LLEKVAELTNRGFTILKTAELLGVSIATVNRYRKINKTNSK